MIFYQVQSWQRHGTKCSEGEDILKKQEGSSIPEYNTGTSNDLWHQNIFFATYEEAKKELDNIYNGYMRHGTRAKITIIDEVKGTVKVYNGC
ncbi:MAG: hypothetical protein FWG98_12115 [Candidatus Cloacimonetes bacterium]|nr:hypothetical protein [Candidatus Cloacimonadota bacterium]